MWEKLFEAHPALTETRILSNHRCVAERLHFLEPSVRHLTNIPGVGRDCQPEIVHELRGHLGGGRYDNGPRLRRRIRYWCVDGGGWPFVGVIPLESTHPLPA